MTEEQYLAFQAYVREHVSLLLPTSEQKLTEMNEELIKINEQRTAQEQEIFYLSNKIRYLKGVLGLTDSPYAPPQSEVVN